MKRIQIKHHRNIVIYVSCHRHNENVFVSYKTLMIRVHFLVHNFLINIATVCEFVCVYENGDNHNMVHDLLTK